MKTNRCFPKSSEFRQKYKSGMEKRNQSHHTIEKTLPFLVDNLAGECTPYYLFAVYDVDEQYMRPFCEDGSNFQKSTCKMLVIASDIRVTDMMDTLEEISIDMKK